MVFLVHESRLFFARSWGFGASIIFDVMPHMVVTFFWP